MEDIIAKVIKIDLDIYYLSIEHKNEIIQSKLRGNLKKSKNILVGDIVKVEKIGQDYMIKDIMNRKNSLIRPPVSNIDQMIIVVSVGAPLPDYTLLDKQLVLCISKNIKPIICVNKIDLIDEDKTVKNDIEYINNIYSKIGVDIVYVSAKNGNGINDLKKLLNGKTSAFSGSSGVGKSSITKNIINNIDFVEIGEIGKKTKRGKHTTKSVKLYTVDKDTYILDTPGFSSYELYDIEYRDLRKYYPEFLNYSCNYDDCMHVLESIDVCAIKQNVEKKNIDKGRYERYVYIYQKLKEQYDRRYK